MEYHLYHEAEAVVGGRFKLAAILQKRIVQLMRGDVKLVDLDTDNLKEVALREIIEKKIDLVCDEGQFEEDFERPDVQEAPPAPTSDPLAIFE
jgi:DNA-directed RNA polymerase subunit K/omega